ncbi:MAG: hypothetical protein GWN29_05015 [Gammaproteobacteria bacterium]|nr:hypothetical protein [Gammaproteobacteria bacterium]NIV51114.1 hypothetical protein [Gammaproteobacteria bacterium]NIW23967.1 hypothetical protein [Gammaproteobacteria bacterium]NIX85056.1 hypothetical protein [Gammaproteobacteria bacterium]
MAEHMFCATRADLTSEQIDRVDAIVQEQGGHGFVWVGRLPGNDIRGWCTGPNRGFPYDRNLERRVAAALRREGLAELFGVGDEDES